MSRTLRAAVAALTLGACVGGCTPTSDMTISDLAGTWESTSTSAVFTLGADGSVSAEDFPLYLEDGSTCEDPVVVTGPVRGRLATDSFNGDFLYLDVDAGPEQVWVDYSLTGRLQLFVHPGDCLDELVETFELKRS